MIRSLIVILFFTLTSGLSLFAQDALRTDILKSIESVKSSKRKIATLETKDSVYLFTFYPKFNNTFFVDFFRNRKSASKSERKTTWLIYSFYFSNDNLDFVQMRRGKKHVSRYFLQEGKIISSDLDTSLPLLSQHKIDSLVKQVQIARIKLK